MDLAKDAKILKLIEDLSSEIGAKNFRLVDHWDGDLCAIGIASVVNPDRLPLCISWVLHMKNIFMFFLMSIAFFTSLCDGGGVPLLDVKYVKKNIILYFEGGEIKAVRNLRENLMGAGFTDEAQVHCILSLKSLNCSGYGCEQKQKRLEKFREVLNGNEFYDYVLKTNFQWW